MPRLWQPLCDHEDSWLMTQIGPSMAEQREGARWALEDVTYCEIKLLQSSPTVGVLIMGDYIASLLLKPSEI